jgi:Ca2+-binding EF-hand superfamily protein
LFNVDARDALSLTELGKILTDLDQQPTEAELQELIQSFGKQHEYSLPFDEIQNAAWSNDCIEKEIEEVWKILDKKQRKFVDAKDLHALVCNTRFKLTEYDLVMMVNEFSKQGNGDIYFAEFRDFMVFLN